MHEDTLNEGQDIQPERTHSAFSEWVRMLRDKEKVTQLTEASIRLNMILAVLSLCLSVGLVVAIWFAVHPDRQYFAADNGQIVPLVPTSQPYQKPAAVIQFARDTLTQSFSMDFMNYAAQLESVRDRYTSEGFASFLASMKKAGVFQATIDKRMVMSITAGTGVLTKEGLAKNGRYVWIIEHLIEIRLSGNTRDLMPQKFLATVRVERIPTNESALGLAVAQIVTVPN